MFEIDIDSFVCLFVCLFLFLFLFFFFVFDEIDIDS